VERGLLGYPYSTDFFPKKIDEEAKRPVNTGVLSENIFFKNKKSGKTNASFCRRGHI